MKNMLFLLSFLTLKFHLNKRTGTENKNYQIKQALPSVKVNLNSSFVGAI